MVLGLASSGLVRRPCCNSTRVDFQSSYSMHESVYPSHLGSPGYLPTSSIPEGHAQSCIQTCTSLPPGTHGEHCYFLAIAASSARIESRWLLESTNSSSRLIFRLPSSSVTMCAMAIASRFNSTPNEVCALPEYYGENTTSGVCKYHNVLGHRREI